MKGGARGSKAKAKDYVSTDGLGRPVKLTAMRRPNDPVPCMEDRQWREGLFRANFIGYCMVLVLRTRFVWF